MWDDVPVEEICSPIGWAKNLAHPVLGERIREISRVLLKHKGKSAVQIFGSLDAEKVRSCMTMFDYLRPNEVFAQVLDAFYKGERLMKPSRQYVKRRRSTRTRSIS